jgi:antitoxin ChpS
MMVSIRQQGGAAVMTIPVEVLRKFDWKAGEKIDLELLDDGFRVRPATKQRKRYTLAELLEGCDETLPFSAEDKTWLESKPVGRELI